MKVLMVLILAGAMIFGYALKSFAGNDSGDILKDALLGAATGAVSSEASGGKAGKGALVGAGVNVIGGALFDAFTGQQVGTVDQVNQMPSQDAFQQGYNTGFTKGYEAGKK